MALPSKTILSLLYVFQFYERISQNSKERTCTQKRANQCGAPIFKFWLNVINWPHSVSLPHQCLWYEARRLWGNTFDPIAIGQLMIHYFLGFTHNLHLALQCLETSSHLKLDFMSCHFIVFMQSAHLPSVTHPEVCIPPFWGLDPYLLFSGGCLPKASELACTFLSALLQYLQSVIKLS